MIKLTKSLGLVGLLFLTGCATTSLKVQPHHEKYAVQVIQVYDAEVSMPIKPDEIIASGSEIEDFPVIYITPGQTLTDGDLTAVIVANLISEVNGVPTIKEEDKGIVQLGKSVTVNLQAVNDNIASLEYKLVNRRIKEFVEMQSSGGKYTMKMPAFNDKSASSSINVKLDQWSFLGANQNSSILIRVLSPSSDHIKDLSIEQIEEN